MKVHSTASRSAVTQQTQINRQGTIDKTCKGKACLALLDYPIQSIGYGSLPVGLRCSQQRLGHRFGHLAAGAAGYTALRCNASDGALRRVSVRNAQTDQIKIPARSALPNSALKTQNSALPAWAPPYWLRSVAMADAILPASCGGDSNAEKRPWGSITKIAAVWSTR